MADYAIAGLNGIHQKHNAALAIALSQVWFHSSPNSKFKSSSSSSQYQPSINNYNAISSSPLPSFIETGLTNCRWPGRAQIFQIPGYSNLTFCIIHKTLSVYLKYKNII